MSSTEASISERRQARWRSAEVRVFVSYDMERADGMATRLAEDLEALGCAVWLAAKDIPPGQQWVPEINEAIVACTHATVLLGRESMSKWMQAEVGVIFDRSMHDDLRVVPVIVDPEAERPPLLKSFQAVDLVADYVSGLRQLASEFGVDGALTAAETRLLDDWAAGFAHLDRRRIALRRQLGQLRRMHNAEDQKAKKLSEAAAEAERTANEVQAAADSLALQAQELAQRARDDAKESTRAIERAEGAGRVAAELQGRLSELEVAHNPTLELIEQARQLLLEARQRSPFGIARHSELVSLLEQPESIDRSRRVDGPAVSAKGFAHRHRITSVVLAAVERSAPPELREEALTPCLEAMAAEVPSTTPLVDDWDESQLRRLEKGLAQAIERSIGHHDGGVGPGLGEELTLQFARYVATTAGRPVEPPTRPARRPEPITPSVELPEELARFEIVLTGVEAPSGHSSIEDLVRTIHHLSRSSPLAPDVSGFFEARRAVKAGAYPLRVLRHVGFGQAASAERSLAQLGGIVEVRPSAPEA